MSVTSETGKRGERAVMKWFECRGCDVERMPSVWPYDLRVDNKRIEVKTCASEHGRWNFHIAKRKNLIKPNADLYVLRLENYRLDGAALHLIIPRPVSKPSFHITREMAEIWCGEYQSFELPHLYGSAIEWDSDPFRHAAPCWSGYTAMVLRRYRRAA